MFEKPRLRERADSRSSRLVYVGEEGEVFLNHAPGELRDICLVEIIGSLEIDFLNVEELSVPFDFTSALSRRKHPDAVRRRVKAAAGWTSPEATANKPPWLRVRQAGQFSEKR
jgi:hypothetical protein